jgi:septum formation protein
VSPAAAPGIILASTSRYRRELLARLGLPFECVPPGINESLQASDTVAELPRRLAKQKAEAVAEHFPQALVIGSDQVAVRDGALLGKPGSETNCRRQLRESSGREVVFLTAVHVINGPEGQADAHVDVTRVRFRQLEAAEIDRYVARERPLDCAGGFKAEALGISLFETIESRDPTALTGLPMIWLCAALRRAGHAVP